VRGRGGRGVHGALVVEPPVRPLRDRGGQLGIVDHDLTVRGRPPAAVTVPSTR
jgi:hypothetical protein